MGSLPSAALVTLQLIVNHAMKKNTHIQKAIGAARFLVEHFDKSEVASNSLKVKQKQVGQPENSLIQDKCEVEQHVLYDLTSAGAKMTCNGMSV